MKNGNYISLDEQLSKVPKSLWTDAQKQRFLLKSKAYKCSIMCPLRREVYQSPQRGNENGKKIL